MNIGDKVRIKRGGGRGLTWKILKIEGDRAQVDLVRGSLLGPQWEDLSSLELEPVRSALPDPNEHQDEPDWATASVPLVSTLPDPNITGPCQVQSSPFCEPSAGQQRMDPTDMLESETSFRRWVQTCQPCYDVQADLYVATVHGRAL